MNNKTNYLQVGANLGILVGLVLVGIQIYQSNALAAAQLFNDNVESTITTQLSMLGESPDESMERVFYEPESATRRDHLIAERYYQVTARQLNRAALFGDSNLYGRSSNISALTFARINSHIFASPHGVAWLETQLQRIPEGPMRDLYVELKNFAAMNLKAKQSLQPAPAYSP